MENNIIEGFVLRGNPIFAFTFCSSCNYYLYMLHLLYNQYNNEKR